jgi:predicted SpoU family rRNA methylase
MVHQEGNRELACHFSESFAEADALATEERSERKRIPLFTRGSESPFVIWGLHVETFWHVLTGFEPLILVVVNGLKVDKELSSLLNLNALVVAKT